MASKKSKTPKFTYLETWNTRYGVQTRIVTRQNGKFIDSTPALETLKHGIPAGR
jgi:hypothetical protein